MTSHIAMIVGVAYVLGECTHDYTELPNFSETVAAWGMPQDPNLWGWGQYHRTRQGRVWLAIESARKTLLQAGVAPDGIDALVLCGVSLPSQIDRQVDLLREFTTKLGVSDKPYFGLTLNRCTTLLTGLQMASALVISGAYRRVLVVAADAAESEDSRLERFAICSDAAASCIVSADGTSGYDILGKSWSGGISTSAAVPDVGGGLAQKATEALQIPGGPHAVAHVFHDNLFLPIIMLREQLAGFVPSQLFLSNIARTGHCFSCDPLINLVDCEALTAIGTEAPFLLACSTPGIRTALLLKKRDS